MDNVSNYAPQIVTLARTILARVSAGEEGMTLEWSGGDLKPRNAYVVGGVVSTLVDNFTEGYSGMLLTLTKWLATNHGLMHYAPIGVWAHDGRIYYDLVTVLPIDSGFEHVAGIARARGELAFGEFDANGDYLITHDVHDSLYIANLPATAPGVAR